MLNPLAVALVFVATFAGCASTMPMEGGMLDDHAATLEKCGVGNYTFYAREETCGAPAAVKPAEPISKSRRP